ncbi:hypothetical protein MWU75_05135 [Ornithinimicrobium sp. F0845]|uniref:hypothetical protein n=1 Tax=Ornithinimicrobium sp. F0845 TaxID=2926412 RepID=UPI001FF5E2ED|nr:hypothetical protein [Ornithinimicrobium sp. F0845]MCK0111520.1 hypothetical protein [Ornithinimicrobium sp. F0845]
MVRVGSGHRLTVRTEEFGELVWTTTPEVAAVREGDHVWLSTPARRGQNIIAIASRPGSAPVVLWPLGAAWTPGRWD